MENSICISFYLRNSTIHLHQSTLKGINNPPFVKFLINQDRKTFIVQPCAEKDFYTTRVHIDQTGKADLAEIYSIGFCGALVKINGWDKNNSYRVYGKMFPGQNIAVFDFSRSEIINENEVAVSETDTGNNGYRQGVSS